MNRKWLPPVLLVAAAVLALGRHGAAQETGAVEAVTERSVVAPAPPAAAAAGTAVKREDRENALLRKRLQEVDAQRRADGKARKEAVRHAEEAEAAAARAAQERDRLTQAVAELKSAAEQNGQTIEELKQMVARLEGAQQAGEKRLAEKDRQAADLATQLMAERRQAATRERRMKEQAAADGDLAARAQEILKRQVARLRTARAGGTGGAPAPEELKEQVQQLQVELDARNAKVGERERKIAELAQQADALRGEVDKALALLSESGKPDVRAFAEDLKARDARYAELKTVHAQNVETLEGLRQNLGRLQNELAQAQADAEVKTRALAKQDEEIRGLRAEVQKGREQSVTEQEHVFDKADGRLKRAVKAQADLEKQVAALEAQLSDQQTRAADKDRAVAGVRQALRDHEILAREAGHLRVSNAEQAEALNRQKRDLRDVVRMAAEQKQELARKATALAARDTELENARADLEAARRKLGEDEKALDAMAENGRLKTAFAETAQQQMRRMTNDLAQARQEQARQAGSLAALTQRLQQATDEAAGLRSAAAQKDALLFTREEQIKIMRATQQRQDQALAKLKAEMAAVKAAAERDAAEREAAEREAAPKIGPEKAPSSPEPAEVRTQRATHGRMAAEYVGTGKYREAEKEYLLLLEADPDDADAHFNLGVLYDDKLKNTAAAALHYREYLRLRPNAHDSAEVRRWIVEAEDR